MQLADLFDLSLRAREHAPALTYEAADGAIHELTFGAVRERAGQWHALSRRGLSRGDRVVHSPWGSWTLAAISPPDWC